MFCPKCSIENSADARFCIKCGTSLSVQPSAVETVTPPADISPQAEGSPSPQPETPAQPQSEIPTQPQAEIPIQPQAEVPPSQGFPPPVIPGAQPQAYQQAPPQGYAQDQAYMPNQGYNQPPSGYQPPPTGGYPPPGYPPHGYPPPGYHQPPPAAKGFLSDVYSRTFGGFLFKKPMKLWGLSLLCSLLVVLAVVLSVLPIIWLPIVFVLQLGMCNIFLRGIRGEPIDTKLLYAGFDKGVFLRNVGGMAWKNLWLIIWLIIPIVGFVFYYIKYYSYRFVPYIILEDPDISAGDALKKSISMTYGFRGSMFGADMIIVAGIVVLTLIFVLIMQIPVIGPILFFIYYLVLVAVTPLIVGTLGAVYYDKISKNLPSEH